jgi:hypothetical protein
VYKQNKNTRSLTLATVEEKMYITRYIEFISFRFACNACMYVYIYILKDYYTHGAVWEEPSHSFFVSSSLSSTLSSVEKSNGTRRLYDFTSFIDDFNANSDTSR